MAYQWGYFDGAGERASRVAQTVGGLVAPSTNWKKFSRDWSAALAREGVKTFHMTDLMACEGAFAHWERGGNRTRRFLGELVGIIRRYVHYAVASTVRLDDWRALNDEYAMKECRISPYGLASFSVLSKSIIWVGAHRPSDLLVPVFEGGDNDRGDREHLLSWVRQLAGGGLDSVKVIEESKSCPPLQAADLLVWEHRSAVSGVVSGTIESLRESLEELLKLDSSYGVIRLPELLQHRKQLGVPQRALWRTWSQRERASWRPSSFSEGTLYPQASERASTLN